MEFVNLSNVCDVYSGYAFKKFNDNKEGMPVIKIGNIKTDGSINKMSCSYTDETPLKKFFSQKDDLYIALSGATTGKVGIMDESGYLINQRVGVIRRKDMNIPINYIKFFLDSITGKILKDAVGAAQPNISPRDILKYKFPLKTYNEMSIISNVLTKINDDIKKCKNYIANLDNIVKSQFIEMFDKAPSVNFELGELANVTSGDSLTSEYIVDEIDAINRYVVYGANGIRGYYKEANRHRESVLIGRVGAQAGNVHYFNGSFFATEHALVIEIHNHEVDCKWLSYDLKNKNLFSIAKGVAQPVISSSSLKKEVIKVPSFELQKKFVEFTRLIDKSKYITFIHSPDGIVKFILLRDFNKNGIILLYLEEVFMLKYDYAINVYYGEEYICSLVAKHAGGYDNVIWWQLDELIKEYEDKKITKELFKNTIEETSEYFNYIEEDLSNVEKFRIDFLNKLVSLPTYPIYSYEEFHNSWGDVVMILNENGKHYVLYDDDNKYLLQSVEFNEELLIKKLFLLKSLN